MKRLAMVAMVAFAVAVGLGAVTPGYTVDTQLDSIAGILTTSSQRLAQAASTVERVDNTLGGMAENYAGLIATVNGYVTDDGVRDALEIGRQERLAEYIAARATMKAESDAAKACFAAIQAHGAAAVKAKIAELGQ